METKSEISDDLSWIADGYRSKRSTKSASIFKNIVTEKGGKIIGEYKGYHFTIDIKCKNDHTWPAWPGNIIKGIWCRKCAGKCPIEAERKFRDVVKQKGGIVLGDYISTHKGVKIQCDKEHTWSPPPSHITSSTPTWCPTCAGLSSDVAKEKFITIVKEKGGRVLGKYMNNRTKVSIECKMGHDWEPIPTNIMSHGYWCPVCAGNSSKVGEERFRKIVELRSGKVLGDYKNNCTYILLECENKHQWSTYPSSISSGRWCHKCRQSRGEALLDELLANYDEIEVGSQLSYPEYPRRCYDKTIKKPEEIELEHDGILHFDKNNYYNNLGKDTLETRRKRDIEKTKLVVEKYKRRMIRTTYRILKCDREELIKVFDEALNTNYPLLYVDAIDNKPFVSKNAEIYNWLTPNIKIN